MLNRSGDSGHPCLVPDFRGKLKKKGKTNKQVEKTKQRNKQKSFKDINRER
jgi:hypothetical protein